MRGGAPRALQPCALLCAALVCLCSSATAEATTATTAIGIPDIRFTDQTYRKYVGKRDRQHPWHDTADVLTKRGYAMSTVQADVVDGSIATALGPMRLSADTPFVLQDFHTAYGIATIWPYCESVSKCLVYVQTDSPAVKKAPITLTLPKGASAVDFYIDAAIDCVATMRAVVKCRALVQPGGVEVRFKVASVCASPFVGRYVGFFDESGDSIDSITLTCKSTVPTAIGLLRVGSKPPAAAVAAAAVRVPDPA